jgi:hypothetical protein
MAGGFGVSVKVKGVPSLEHAFRDLARDVLREAERDQLLRTAERVRAGAAERFSPISASSAASFRVKGGKRRVSVQQTKRKTTGQHPEFGRLQMQRALLPALKAEETPFVSAVEKVVGELIRRHGF